MTALEWPEFRSLSRCNQGGIIVESRPFEERHKSPRPPRPGGWKQRLLNLGYVAAVSYARSLAHTKSASASISAPVPRSRPERVRIGEVPRSEGRLI